MRTMTIRVRQQHLKFCEGVFPGLCVRTAAKTMVLEWKKKTEGTTSAIFGDWTAAKCCKLEKKFHNLDFSPST